jgi:hypothetical protein
MKELAHLRIIDADPRIKDVPSEDLYEKIDLIYSLGYVYNPYEQGFYNPFIKKGLKAIVTYNLNLNRIENLHENLEREYFEKNEKVKTFDEISNSIYGNDKVSIIGLFFESMSGIFGVIFLILSTIILFTSNVKFAACCLITSFICINFYLVQNLLIEKNENEWKEMNLSPIWLNYKNFFLVIFVLVYPYLYYQLFIIQNNYWLPVFIIFSLKWSINKIVEKKLSRQFWRTIGINTIREYATENGYL